MSQELGKIGAFELGVSEVKGSDALGYSVDEGGREVTERLTLCRRKSKMRNVDSGTKERDDVVESSSSRSVELIEIQRETKIADVRRE